MKQSVSLSGGTSNHTVQFRIRRGALCEGGPESDTCVETSFDPQTESTLVFDEDYERSEGEGEGIIGLKFPPVIGQVLQQKINIIIEKIALQTGERCIPEENYEGSGFTPGRELAPCYRIRTEPYRPGHTEHRRPDPVRHVPGLVDRRQQRGRAAADAEVELREEEHHGPGPVVRRTGLVLLLPGRLRGGGRADDAVVALCCEHDAAAAPAAHPGGSAAGARVLRIVRSPANGSLMDFSSIVVEADDHYEAAFLTPIGSADATGEDNLLNITPTVAVRLCLLAGNECATSSTGSAPPNWWAGTATWDAAGLHYQVNWNTPRNQVPGTYRINLESLNYVIISPEDINITFGTASYTHNAGRTLPLKFYLKRP